LLNEANVVETEGTTRKKTAHICFNKYCESEGHLPEVRTCFMALKLLLIQSDELTIKE
jgi:hypothetical protein